ncbi:hypothetical protein [Nigerium massiliense]|uniref:hypothetical protein n=1 Tax=Nigerium massiliense TaxID=1522317 RepID=UPI0006938DA6|nr:hypothetical protein [Nigerium massiliense]
MSLDSHTTRRRLTGKFWAHVAFALVGLAAVLWALTLAAHPSIRCRGVEMGPGDVCAKADQPDRTQSYEQRLATIESARPVVGGAGAVAAGFGLWLASTEWKRSGRPE